MQNNYYVTNKQQETATVKICGQTFFYTKNNKITREIGLKNKEGETQ